MCETWSTTQGDEKKNGSTSNGEYKRRKNKELEMLFNKPNIILEWASHVW